jgi:predicted ATP-dependent endonuclease of OLD family
MSLPVRFSQDKKYVSVNDILRRLTGANKITAYKKFERLDSKLKKLCTLVIFPGEKQAGKGASLSVITEIIRKAGRKVSEEKRKNVLDIVSQMTSENTLEKETQENDAKKLQLHANMQTKKKNGDNKNKNKNNNEAKKKRKYTSRQKADNNTHIERKFRQAKRNAEKRGLVWSLSFNDWNFLHNQNCYYCGLKATGIDRFDNDQGYKDGNVAPCCWTCNRWKSNLSPQNFIAHALVLSEHLQKWLK